MSKLRKYTITGLSIITLFLTGAPYCPDSFARTALPPDITIVDEEAADSDGGQDGYFTIDSYQDDVERIQGKPDDKFFDGERMIWYYGQDAVYIDFYGRVTGVENHSGKLKVR